MPPASPDGTAPATISLASPAFSAGGAIPVKYTCHGEDISPALQWSGIPPGTQSIALIMDDPDAPVGTWVHWIVYNLPPSLDHLPEAASRANGDAFTLDSQAYQGKTSFGRQDYGGPCPPSGAHRYFFKLYALDISLDQPGLDKDALLAAMQGHILAYGEIIGIYK